MCPVLLSVLNHSQADEGVTEEGEEQQWEEGQEEGEEEPDEWAGADHHHHHHEEPLPPIQGNDLPHMLLTQQC